MAPTTHGLHGWLADEGREGMAVVEEKAREWWMAAVTEDYERERESKLREEFRKLKRSVGRAMGGRGTERFGAKRIDWKNKRE